MSKSTHVLVSMDDLNLVIAKVVVDKNIEALQLIKKFYQVDLSETTVSAIAIAKCEGNAAKASSYMEAIEDLLKH